MHIPWKSTFQGNRIWSMKEKNSNKEQQENDRDNSHIVMESRDNMAVFMSWEYS